MRFIRHIDGRRFHMRGAQVNQGVLEDAAEILNVPLHREMRTNQMVDAIVNDSYGRPDPQERRGIQFLTQIARAYAGGKIIVLSDVDKLDVDQAIAWLERGGKRR